MTETTNTPTNLQAAADAAIPVRPADVLMNLIVALLAPMFLGASAGDIALSRMAALETVNAYRVRNHADLLAVAQIIACGIAALGSLSLSMADDISLSMTLRLRASTNALNRSADRNRRAISESRPEESAPYRSESPYADSPLDPADADFEAAVLARVAESQKRVADTQSHLHQPTQPAERAPTPIVLPTVATSAVTQQRHQAIWAAAMTEVAGEFAAGLSRLPPVERKLASMRAAALSSSANALLSSASAPRDALTKARL
jgi:hypothetical protein